MVSPDASVAVVTHLDMDLFGTLETRNPEILSRLNSSRLEERDTIDAFMAGMVMHARWACIHNYTYYVHYIPRLDDRTTRVAYQGTVRKEMWQWGTTGNYPFCCYKGKEPRVIGWCKLIGVLDLLDRGYDWVVVLGADAWVRNVTANLYDLLYLMGVNQTVLANKSIFMLENRHSLMDKWPPPAEGSNVGTGLPNADIAFIKNTMSSWKALRKWWDGAAEPGFEFQEISMLWRLLGLDESKRPRTWSLNKDPLVTEQLEVLAEDPSAIAAWELRLQKANPKTFSHLNVSRMAKAHQFLWHAPGLGGAGNRRKESFRDLHEFYGLPDWPDGVKVLRDQFFLENWMDSYIWSRASAEQHDHPKCAPILEVLRNRTL
jgi:hypothetical protein